MMKNEEEKQQGAPEQEIAAASVGHAEDCATNQEAASRMKAAMFRHIVRISS